MNKITPEGLALIKAKEGLYLTAYYDVNGYAIGYGMHQYSDGKPVQKQHKITKDFAEKEFLLVVNRYGKQVSKLIKVAVSDSQFSALVSYAYNRGIGSLTNSVLLKMVNANPDNPAIVEQFVIEWGTAEKYKAQLIQRRKEESNLYKLGIGTATLANKISPNYIIYAVLILIVGAFLYSPDYWISHAKMIFTRLFSKRKFSY